MDWNNQTLKGQQILLRNEMLLAGGKVLRMETPQLQPDLASDCDKVIDPYGKGINLNLVNPKLKDGCTEAKASSPECVAEVLTKTHGPL